MCDPEILNPEHRQLSEKAETERKEIMENLRKMDEENRAEVPLSSRFRTYSICMYIYVYMYIYIYKYIFIYIYIFTYIFLLLLYT